MSRTSKAATEARRARYKPGSRVELERTLDPQSKPEPGARGTVTRVDDAGNLFCTWDNGLTGILVCGVDMVKLLPTTQTIREQARKAAAARRVDLADARAVFEVAVEMDFVELANLTFTDPKLYSYLVQIGEIAP